KDAVRVCREAGMRPVMITGDHRDTAAAIARELRISEKDSEIITGIELDLISDDDFIDKVKDYSVYARVSPTHKVRIVEAWKKNGKVVAMTGDGVNDAPALKISNIGIGMGITGTDVSKGVSDMVLSDDNFATIVVAVEEGRKIYSNIRKAIQFLLSANLGEVLTLFVATMLNWTILLPIHILWVNLVTDTFPALALGFEKAEKDIMKRPPVKSGISFFAGGMGTNIVYQGLLEGMITLLSFYVASTLYEDNTTAITVAFATLGLVQLFHAYNVRSNTHSVFGRAIPFNPHLLGAVIISALLQVAVIIIPVFNRIFKVSHLTAAQWGLVIACSFSIIPMVEIVKLGGKIISKVTKRHVKKGHIRNH
ncbi:MAG: cation-translocating P-type ATPase, partial [Eubacteriales bacterium]|nr:cation-translocating P-type ATPase [Eubacteriales bacterium]